MRVWGCSETGSCAYRGEGRSSAPTSPAPSISSGFPTTPPPGGGAGRVVPYPADAPLSPLGYGIWAEGLGLVLNRLAAEVTGTPLLVAEYGIGTERDEDRAEYLRAGLSVVRAALSRGIDVRGLFHWTGVD